MKKENIKNTSPTAKASFCDFIDPPIPNGITAVIDELIKLPTPAYLPVVPNKYPRLRI